MSLFLETAPPPQSLIVQNPVNVNDTGGQLVSLREDLLAKLESIEPRIQNLPTIFSRAISIREKHVAPVGDQILKDYEELQKIMPEIHQKAISTARKVQELSLNSQTTSALAVPRATKVIRDQFSALQADYDSALQNIAKLVKNLNSKHGAIAKSFESFKQIPNQLTKSQGTITELKQKISGINQQFEELKVNINNNIDKSFHAIAQQLDSQISEAESVIDKLTQQTEDGYSTSLAHGQQLQSQKFDIIESFNSLSKSIADSTENQMKAISIQIDKLHDKAFSSISEIQSDLSISLDAIADETSSAQHYALIDQIDQEKELAEVESLNQKLITLTDQLAKLKENPVQQQKLDESPEMHSVLIDGVQKTVLCFSDGTFTITE